jgi:plasmid stability protein
VPPVDHNERTPSSAFRPTEDIKEIEVDPNDPTKIVRIRTQLPTK